ncbi:MAG: MarR family winged helix-turn-helix transcriptional regulator [Longimicrobiales bacterium]
MAKRISLHQQALVAVLAAGGRLRRQLGSVLEAEGLSASQYNVLRILRGAGEPLPIMTIRDRMMDPEPSITRLVDRLEKKGLITRHRREDDRRCVECQLTKDGIALLASLDEPVDKADRHLMKRLTTAELGMLRQLSDKVGIRED